ncbi:LANO_0H22144g1_1 [Lachancea nothofagi CBS 11611]|uniref:chitinase n=1 Tax=Lachancea nothofagi CBS 11611 TaxID=1266666 RepID=A0A1G4KNQ3_9SACH|nr:LANO_0H22144g1_1 [Lachancea nothofagi CBS 11611]
MSDLSSDVGKHRAWRKLGVFLCIIGIILEALFLGNIFKWADKKIITSEYNSVVRSKYMMSVTQDKDHELEYSDQGFMSGVYYSNWSPYKARNHFPHDIDFRQVTHVFYSFFVVDADSGECRSSDEWSDSQMDVYKQMMFSFQEMNFTKTYKDQDLATQSKLPLGCLGELFYLKYSNFLVSRGGPAKVNNFKTLMSVGGWSNRSAFKSLADNPQKLQKFLDSCIENMFKYGVDGIDIDWEFPENNSQEPQIYLEMMKSLREKLDKLENAIFGSEQHSQHFLLTTAISADPVNLEHLPLSEIEQSVNYFNLMAYDFSGSWSERTAYQSNLYDMDLRSKRDHSADTSADHTVQMLMSKFNVPSSKIILGMPAYGRGFKKVSAPKDNDNVVVNMKFHGVKGTSEGEDGISLYKTLPPNGYQEHFDPEAVSAFCIKKSPIKSSTNLFVYDNPDSMSLKAKYVLSHQLGGGFWWESCGEDYRNKDRSLTRRFTQELKIVKKAEPTIYLLPQVALFYRKTYPNGFLTPLLSP